MRDNAVQRAKVILTVAQAEADRKLWHDVRSKGIGGSDAACIMGLSPWKSAFALWAEKTGRTETPDLEDNEYIYWGNALEEVVAKRFTELSGKRVRKCGTMARTDKEYMLANVDRLVIGEEAGLECKTTSAYKVSDWDGDQLPDAYYCQCQWYMAVTGFNKWYIACLIGGNKFVWKEIPRNDSFISELEASADWFWNTNIIGGSAPDLDGNESTTTALESVYKGGAAPECSIQLPSLCGAYIERYDTLKATKKAVEEELTLLENCLKQQLGEFQQGEYQGRKVAWKYSKPRVTVDSARLKTELPEVYAKYSKTGEPTRRFTLK